MEVRVDCDAGEPNVRLLWRCRLAEIPDQIGVSSLPKEVVTKFEAKLKLTSPSTLYDSNPTPWS
jgi:hypothetical protein